MNIFNFDHNTPQHDLSRHFVSFQKAELKIIMDIYGKMVSSGIWKDYAIDHKEKYAYFSIFKKSGDSPLYIIEKDPKAAQKQGLYSLKDQSMRVLKRGSELRQVIDPLYKQFQKIEMKKLSR